MSEIDVKTFAISEYYNQLFGTFIACRPHSNDAVNIHITHTDLDGLACAAIPDIIFNMVVTNSYSMCGMFHDAIKYFVNQPNDLMKTVRSVLDEYWDKYRARKRISLLITDLGGFDPSVIGIYRDRGMRIDYLYVDHHNNPGIDNCSREVFGESSLVFVNKDHSATKWLGEMFLTALDNNYSYVNHTDHFGTTHMQRILEYINAVSTYDCGRWPAWSHAEDIIDLPVEIQEQLHFSTITVRNGTDKEVENSRYKYLEYITRRVSGEELYSRDYARFGNTGRVLTDEFIRLKKDIWTLHNPKLIVSIVDGKPAFINDMEPDPTFVAKLNEFTYPESMEGRYGIVHTNATEPLANVSLASREMFEINPEIDFLINLYPKQNKVELRSAVGRGPSMYEMAAANGGGGHYNAAGFPTKF